MTNLKNRDFLKIADFNQEELSYLLRLAARLKKLRKEGKEPQFLKGKNVALVFEKTSTRTRCAFETSLYDQGAHATYLSDGSQIGKKESMADTARVLSRMYDGIEYRGYGQEIVNTLAEYSGVPVWNGLTNESHPTQFLADLLTIMEHCPKPLDQIKVCFAGTADNNVALSLMVGCAKMGMQYAAAAPAAYHPAPELVEKLRREEGARITITDDIATAVKDADIIYTDVWVSMGEPAEIWDERIKLLRPYQVNRRMMELTGNPDCKFMHCLPAFHDLETVVGEEIYRQYGLREMEVTDEVFESPASIVFDEAENRMHTIKAVMVATLSQQPETTL